MAINEQHILHIVMVLQQILLVFKWVDLPWMKSQYKYLITPSQKPWQFFRNPE